jgi:hypothetical protein
MYLHTRPAADTPVVPVAPTRSAYAADDGYDGSDGGLDYGKIKAQNVDFDGVLGPVGPADVVFADGFDGP